MGCCHSNTRNVWFEQDHGILHGVFLTFEPKLSGKGLLVLTNVRCWLSTSIYISHTRLTWRLSTLVLRHHRASTMHGFESETCSISPPTGVSTHNTRCPVGLSFCSLIGLLRSQRIMPPHGDLKPACAGRKGHSSSGVELCVGLLAQHIHGNNSLHAKRYLISYRK